MYNYFISYTQKNVEWARWIAWILEEMGYSVVLQDWDFIAGKNFIIEMDRATKESEKTIAILSNDYMESVFTRPEWAAAFAEDPIGQESKLIPVRVENCNPSGLLKQINYIDLVGINDVDEAKRIIENKIGGKRLKPIIAPQFPGDIKKK